MLFCGAMARRKGITRERLVAASTAFVRWSKQTLGYSKKEANLQEASHIPEQFGAKAAREQEVTFENPGCLGEKQQDQRQQQQQQPSLQFRPQPQQPRLKGTSIINIKPRSGGDSSSSNTSRSYSSSSKISSSGIFRKSGGWSSLRR
ncbi:hypothetical protein ACSSS7_002614 [Eimeria intestinalis]